MTDHHPEWLKDYLAGMTNPQYWRLVIDGNAAAVIAMRGHSYWSGDRNVYAPAMQWLVTKGMNYWEDRCRVRWDGRITKGNRQEMETLLAQRDAP